MSTEHFHAPRKKKIQKEVKKPILEGTGVTKKGVFIVRYGFSITPLKWERKQTE